MSIGFVNVTNTSIELINNVGNYTNPAEIFVYINHVMFNDFLFYPLFWLLAIILFVTAQNIRKEPLSNLLYAFGITSIVAIFARTTQAFILGSYVSLLIDHQFWTFPILTALIAMIIWATKK
jgi:hypothetical protein